MLLFFNVIGKRVRKGREVKWEKGLRGIGEGEGMGTLLFLGDN